MAMKDLAYSEQELKDREVRCCDTPAEYKGPKYPWGLELRLENETLKKLGVSASSFKAGEELPLTIMTKVTSINVNETAEGGRSECLGLVCAQIDMGGESSDADKAEKLYGKK